jgi:hypothetical protein
VLVITRRHGWIENLGKSRDVRSILFHGQTNSSSPWRIVDDCGGAFALGAIGGTFFHSIKGFRHAPSVRLLAGLVSLCDLSFYSSYQGQYRRLLGSLNAVKQRAPRVGGNTRAAM